MFERIKTDFAAATFRILRLLLSVTIWSCHVWVAPAFRLCRGPEAEPHPQEGGLKLKFLNPRPRSRNKFGMTERVETNSHVTLNPESVVPNLFRHPFRAGLFQHPVCFFSAFSRRSLNKSSTPRPFDPLNPSGVTLIELILVMVIIGILAATVLPRIDFGTTSSRASVDGAAYMIASDIQYAQECAMANRVSKTIRFTVNQSSYTFPPTVPSTSGLDPSGQLASLKNVTILTTIDFTFNSLGEPTAGGGNFVRVWDGVNTRTITVTLYTGKVDIS